MQRSLDEVHECVHEIVDRSPSIDQLLSLTSRLRQLTSFESGVEPPIPSSLLCSSNRSYNPILSQALEFLESSLEHGIQPTEAAVAEALGIHRTQLSRLLACTAHVGFCKLRRVVVARRALTLLLTTNENVSQIAYALGFDHPTQLAREFRHECGVTPSDIRRLYGCHFKATEGIG